MKNKMVWTGLEHKLWSTKQDWPKFNRLLVALSGGADSTVLLSVFQRFSFVCRFELIAVYVHHGPGELNDWRNDAGNHCRALCENLKISFIQAGPSLKDLKSESELRTFRYSELRKIQMEQKCDFILTAHHADDLLETRMIRLLRGTGPQGLEALKTIEYDLWRPLLSITKTEIIEYLKETKIKYLEDPSNNCLDPLRNWLRKDLFVQINQRQLGMVENLGRSLQLMVDALSLESHKFKLEPDLGAFEFSVTYYLSLSPLDQNRLIASLLISLGVKDYSRGQIEEVRKRLDKINKVHNFTLGPVRWEIDAKQVKVSLKSEIL